MKRLSWSKSTLRFIFTQDRAYQNICSQGRSYNFDRGQSATNVDPPKRERKFWVFVQGGGGNVNVKGPYKQLPVVGSLVG